MKRLVPAMVVAVALVLSAQTSRADCSDPPIGPQTFGIVTWYDYTPDPADDCWDESAPMDVEATACSSADGYDYPYGAWTTEYTFDVIDDDEEVFGTWWVTSQVKLYDPHDNWYNSIKLSAIVVHNSTPTTTTLFEHHGSQGDLNCSTQFTNFFNAAAGDQVTIRVQGTKWWEDTVVQATLPHIENSTH